ncbi:MAG: hypothetical protein ABIO70_07200 [Pseudomonadota bacterium]
MKLASTILHIAADVVLVAAFVFMAWWAGSTFAGRVGFPFDLEWMEGGMLLHALRVRDGLPLYVAPSPEFIPFIYPPGYPWLVGMLGRVLPLGYALARSVSFAGTGIAALLLILGVRQEGHRWSLGFGAAALFLSCYEDVGAFFDLVRTDGMQLALMGGALLLCRRASRRAVAVGGLLLFLAFTTKHNMAMLGLPIVVALWRHHGWRRAAWFTACSAGPALLWTAWMQISSHGYFLTYILAVPATHPIVGTRLFPTAEKELLSAFPAPLAAAALVPAAALLSQGWRRLHPTAGQAPSPCTGDASFARWYWIGTMAMGLFMVVLMRGHHGGYVNVLMPGYWLLALVVGLGLGALARRWRPPLLQATLLLAGAGMIAGQCWAGRWERDRFLPTQADLAAGQQVLDTLRGYQGAVLMPHSPYYPVMVGKEPSFALIALWDITHAHSPLKREAKAIDRAIREQRFDAIILASRKFEYGLHKAYQQSGSIHLKGRALMPKSGWRARPSVIFEPKPDAPPPPGRHGGRGRRGGQRGRGVRRRGGKIAPDLTRLRRCPRPSPRRGRPRRRSPGAERSRSRWSPPG